MRRRLCFAPAQLPWLVVAIRCVANVDLPPLMSENTPDTTPRGMKPSTAHSTSSTGIDSAQSSGCRLGLWVGRVLRTVLRVTFILISLAPRLVRPERCGLAGWRDHPDV